MGACRPRRTCQPSPGRGQGGVWFRRAPGGVPVSGCCSSEPGAVGPRQALPPWGWPFPCLGAELGLAGVSSLCVCGLCPSRRLLGSRWVHVALSHRPWRDLTGLRGAEGGVAASPAPGTGESRGSTAGPRPRGVWATEGDRLSAGHGRQHPSGDTLPRTACTMPGDPTAPIPVPGWRPGRPGAQRGKGPSPGARGMCSGPRPDHELRPHRSRRRRARTPRCSATMSWCPCRCGS